MNPAAYKDLSMVIWVCFANGMNIIEQVASCKWSLLLKIQQLNTQILQLFITKIKMEIIYKSN